MDNVEDGTTLVSFYATWCGPCKVMKPTVEKFDKSRDDVKVVYVNVDEDQDAVAKFAVSSIPTVVGLEDGKEFGRFSGTKNLSYLNNFVENKGI